MLKTFTLTLADGSTRTVEAKTLEDVQESFKRYDGQKVVRCEEEGAPDK